MKKVFPLLFFPFLLLGNPQNPDVVSGNVSFETHLQNLQITASERAIIHWDSFSIAEKECTKFLQPAKGSAVLNRVTGGDISEILGKLDANGNVYLINPSGIIIGENALIDVAGLVFSTLDLLDEAFLKNEDLLFSGDLQGSLLNLGTIQAESGDVVLLAKKITNKGKISAETVSLASGVDILLQPKDREKVFIKTAHPESFIENEGVIEAIRTEILADGNPYAMAIQHSGRIDALSVEERNGEVYLSAGKGCAIVSGNIVSKGGEVRILGNQVGLTENARVDVSNATSAGTVLLGGDLHGGNPEVPNASYAYLGKDACIEACSLECGDGGKVIVWGDDLTVFEGTISAKGGGIGGKGGFIEVSSPKELYIEGKIDTKSPGGMGTVYFDPVDPTIVFNGGVDVGVTSPPPIIMPTTSYVFGAAAPTIDSSNLSTNLTMANIIIDATTGAGGSGLLTVSSPVTWDASPAAPTSLTLIGSTIQIDSTISSMDASASPGTTVIDLQAPVIAFGNAAHTISANVAATSGDISVSSPTSLSIFGGGGSNSGISATSGDITVTTGTLSLESGAALETAQITTTTGDISCTATGDISITADGAVASIGALTGNVTMNGSGDFTIISGSAAAANATCQTLIGNVNAMITGDYTITAGTGASATAGFLVNGASGNITTSGRDYFFTSGGGGAVIGTNVATTGSVSVTATGPTGISLLLGGDAPAFIASLNLTGNNPVTVNTTDLRLDGGPFAGAMDVAAVVGASSGDTFVTATGDIFCLGGGGISENRAGIGSASPSVGDIVNISCRDLTCIGGTTPNSTALINGSDVTVNVSRNLALTEGSGTDAAASVTSPTSPGSITIDVGGNLAITGTGAFSGVNATNGPVNVAIGGNATLTGPFGVIATVSGGAINCNIAGDLSINATTGAAITGMVACFTSGVGDLTVNARNIAIMGGTDPMATAALQTGAAPGSGGDGSVDITVTGGTGITLNGGTAASATAAISTNGTNPNNSIAINMSNPSSNLILNGSAVAAGANAEIRNHSGGNLTDPVGNDIILNGTAMSPAIIEIAAGGSGNLLVQAGRNIQMNDFATIQNLGPGELNIVVDNDFPSPLLFGTGAFITTAGSTVVTAGGPLRIFSSQQSLNMIASPLNGAAFVPGPEFIDSTQERWFVYFPDSFGGVPFTIFYKNSQLTGNVLNEFATATAEPFRDWEIYYDRIIFVKTPLKLFYGTESETRFPMRNSYRNYHTLKLYNDYLP